MLRSDSPGLKNSNLHSFKFTMIIMFFRPEIMDYCETCVLQLSVGQESGLFREVDIYEYVTIGT